MTTRITRWMPRALAAVAGLAAVAPSLAVSTTIAGGVLYWTDREGGVHPAKGIYTQLWEVDSLTANDDLGSQYTASTGAFSLITNEEDGTGDNYLEVRARIWGSSNIVGDVTDTGGLYYATWFPDSSSYWQIPIGAGTGSTPVGNFGAVTLDNDTYLGRIVGVLQAADHIMSYYRYTKSMNAPVLNSFKYDDTIAGSSLGHSNFQLRFTAWDDWDVIFHEIGHHIAHHNNFDYREPVTENTPWAGSHTPGFDCIGGTGTAPAYTAGDVNGTRRAWAEGIATTLGMFAVHDGNLAAAIPGLPAHEYDTFYRSDSFGGKTVGGDFISRVTDAQIGTRYDLETATNNATLTSGTTVFNAQYRGEGDEWSVSNTLWDYYDAANDGYTTSGAAGRSDRVNMGVDRVMQDMAGADNFRDYWVNLTVTSNTAAFRTGALGIGAGDSHNRTLAILGEVLEEHQISAVPITSGAVANALAMLTFQEQNTGHSDKFRVAVFDSNWALHDLSGIFTDSDNDIGGNASSTDTYTITNPLVLGQTYYWVALSSSILDNAAPLGAWQNWYWSGANTITYVPAPGVLAMLGFTAAAGIRRRPVRPAPGFPVRFW